MSSVLVTGASGFIGRRLIARLRPAHEVIALSRTEVEDVDAAVRGAFASAADLKRLDGYEIDTVVHLAAVLEDASEEECLAVNLLGSARLLRYAVERGCRHLVLASSVAATGCMSNRFLPYELPIGDDHPCRAYEPYGMSKALVEEQALYLQRQIPELEIALIRVGGVIEAGWEQREDVQALRAEMPFLFGGLVMMDDLVDDFALVVERRLGPGVRRFNAVNPTLIGTSLTTAELLRETVGDRAAELDLGSYEEEGRECASYFAAGRLRRAYAEAAA